jgi:hypothetical protein
MKYNIEQVETYNDNTMRTVNNEVSDALTKAGHKHKKILWDGVPCIKFINNSRGAQFMREWISNSEYDFGFNLAFNK